MQKRSTNNHLRISGRIETVFYSSLLFTAGRLVTSNHDRVQFAGKIYVQEGELVVLQGVWIQNPKFGRQFEVQEMVYDLDLDQNALASFLSNHPDIIGIGPVRAKKIAEHFGNDFDQWIERDPKVIADAVGVKLDIIHNLQEVWQKAREMNRVMAWLSGFGLTHHQVTILVEKFGSNTLSILKGDPYILIREVAGFGFKKVDVIARKMGTYKERPERIRAGIIHTLNEALDQGNCWVEYEELVTRVNTLLVMDCLDSRERIEKELDGLIDEKTLKCVAHSGRFLIAKPSIHRMEEDLAKIFAQAYSPNKLYGREVKYDVMFDALAPELNVEQRQAAQCAFMHSITLISGGAGSGKTYTISSITNICQSRGLEVILCAPTGKAAKRIEQVTGQEASTIHRLLGYNGREYLRGSDNPVEADLLIVDEVSMVDVPLMWQLFQAIDLNKTFVILVGDHNQLPPVGPGNPLRDLIRTRSIPMVILDKVVRQAGVLKENSTAILGGEVRPTSELLPNGRRAWYRSDGQKEVAAAQQFLLELFESVLVERLGFDLVQDVQVLTPTHKGPLGTVELNVQLQRLIQRKLWQVEVPTVRTGRRPPLQIHDKVIQTKNDYKIDVMNGAIGTVIEVKSDGTLVIDFDGKAVTMEKGSSNRLNIELAYCLSIHKAQGSEYPCAIIIAHKAHSFMHHRNLLYTGVTRARETAILIGDSWGMRNCAKVRKLDSRKTFLSIKLLENSTP